MNGVTTIPVPSHALLLATLAACGSSPTPKPPAPPSLTMPIAGLEAVKRGDSHEAVAAAFPTAEPGGDDDLWVEDAIIETRPASVGLLFEDGGLRGAAIAFDDPCDQLDAVATGLDAKLGERTSAQEGI